MGYCDKKELAWHWSVPAGQTGRPVVLLLRVGLSFHWPAVEEISKPLLERQCCRGWVQGGADRWALQAGREAAGVEVGIGTSRVVFGALAVLARPGQGPQTSLCHGHRAQGGFRSGSLHPVCSSECIHASFQSRAALGRCSCWFSPHRSSGALRVTWWGERVGGLVSLFPYLLGGPCSRGQCGQEAGGWAAGCWVLC